MAPRDDDTLKILVTIANDIGATKEGISHLKNNVETLSDDFKDVKQQIANTVKLPECIERHNHASINLGKIKDELIMEIKKSTTSTSNKAVTSDMLNSSNPVTPHTIKEVEEGLQERREQRVEKRRKTVAFWLATITGVVCLLSGCIIGVYKIVVFIDKVEATISGGTQEVKSEIQKSNRKIIYVQIPIPTPDGGSTLTVPVVTDDFSMSKKRLRLKK